MRNPLPLLLCSVAAVVALAACRPQPAPAGTFVIGEGDQYVALGDSYTAAPRGGPGPDGCYRSADNYPSQIADATGADLLDVSCNAASTEHLHEAQETPVGSHPAQLRALDEDTDLVTMGIGANDFGVMAGLLFNCANVAATDPDGSPCKDADRADGTSTVASLLERTGDRIVEAVAEIRDRAPGARVLVIGYPQIVPAEGTCDQYPIADGDYPYARQVIEDLNASLEDATERSGAEFVDVYDVSEGHDICSDDPWIAGVLPRPGLAAPYHPYPEEQERVAELVLQAIES